MSIMRSLRSPTSSEAVPRCYDELGGHDDDHNAHCADDYEVA